MSELMVPEGWEVVKIGNISELINGRVTCPPKIGPGKELVY